MKLLLTQDLTPEDRLRVRHAVDLAWCGGYICGRGSFMIQRKDSRIKFQIMGTYDEIIIDLERLVRITRIPVSPRELQSRGSRKAMLTVYGETVHELMLQVWPHLTHYRRLRYNALRTELGKEPI